MFPTVEQSVPAHLISNAPMPARVPVSLNYGAGDPLAVHMVFPASASLSGDGVTWTFARALLDSGLRAPAGAGDVHIWPGGGGRTMVELRSPEGVALLRFATAELRDFLNRSYTMVPAEGEDDVFDVDAGLAELLRQASG
jgi:hypothetical protein